MMKSSEAANAVREVQYDWMNPVRSSVKITKIPCQIYSMEICGLSAKYDRILKGGLLRTD